MVKLKNNILLILITLLVFNQKSFSQEIIDFENYTWKFDGTEGFKVVVRLNTENIKSPAYSIDLSLKSEHSNFAVLNMECKNRNDIGEFSQLIENSVCTISRKPLENFPSFVDIEFWFHAMNHTNPKEPGLELHRWDIDVTDKEKYHISYKINNIESSNEEELWVYYVLKKTYGSRVVSYKYDDTGNYQNKNFVLTFDSPYNDKTIKKVLDRFPDTKLIIKIEPPPPPLPNSNISKVSKEWQKEKDKRKNGISFIQELEYLEFIQIEDAYRFICIRFYKDTPEEIKKQHEQFAIDICRIYDIELIIRPGVIYTEKLICALKNEFSKIEDIVKFSITNNAIFHFNTEVDYSIVSETDKKTRIRQQLNKIFNKYKIEPEYSIW